MLAHDVIQDPVNSLPIVKFLSDFSLISLTPGADDWGKHGPTKDFLDVAAKGFTPSALPRPTVHFWRPLGVN